MDFAAHKRARTFKLPSIGRCAATFLRAPCAQPDLEVRQWGRCYGSCCNLCGAGPVAPPCLTAYVSLPAAGLGSGAMQALQQHGGHGGNHRLQLLCGLHGNHTADAGMHKHFELTTVAAVVSSRVPIILCAPTRSCRSARRAKVADTASSEEGAERNCEIADAPASFITDIWKHFGFLVLRNE